MQAGATRILLSVRLAFVLCALSSMAGAQTWTVTGSMNSTRSLSTQRLLNSEMVRVIGGQAGGASLASVDLKGNTHDA
jgi:hypothetical protein